MKDCAIVAGRCTLTGEIIMKTLEQLAYEVAVRAAKEASRLVLSFWPNPLNPNLDRSRKLEIFDKDEGVGNYATTADKKSEQLIVDMIRREKRFADHGIEGEESTSDPSKHEWRWIIDPIDGTLVFNHGLPEFGVCIGLIHEQEAVMGVIAMPAKGQMIAAIRGEKAVLLTLAGKEVANLKVINARKPVGPLTKTIIAYDLCYENRERQLRTFLTKIADKIAYPVSYASCAAANFRLAQRLVGGYFTAAPTIFDIGAAAAIIPEIGGKVTDIQGRPIDWTASTRSYLASHSPEIHAQLIELLNN